MPVLPQWQQEANVWAVYPTRLERSAKVRVCVEFLQTFLQAQPLAANAAALRHKG